MIKAQPTLLALSLLLGAGGLWLGLAQGPAVDRIACRPGADAYRRVELVFGLARKDRPDITEEDWRQFLDREVTPRFPDGLTVLAGSGQWRNAAGVAVKEPSRLLLVWAKPAGDFDARIEAIRAAWKNAHQQESVLRAERADCVSF